MTNLVTLILRLLIFELVLGGVIFGSAGRLDLPWFWAVIVIHAVSMAAVVPRIDPELRKERFSPGPGGKDRLLRLIALPIVLVHLVVAGLDAGRFHWSGEVAVSVHAAGLVVYTLGLWLAFWAMSANRFFSPVVRIQKERGHHLITTGPYRFVRHPGYVGVIAATLGGGLALGSYWSLVPLVVLFLLFIRRTALEDRFLLAELEGYAEFAQKVRYRLLPGIW